MKLWLGHYVMGDGRGVGWVDGDLLLQESQVPFAKTATTVRRVPHYCIFIEMVELYSSVVGQYLMLIMI